MCFKKDGRFYYTAKDLQDEWNISKATAHRKFNDIFSDIIKEKKRVGTSKKPIQGVSSEIFWARVLSRGERQNQLESFDEYNQDLKQIMKKYTKLELANKVLELTNTLGQAEWEIKILRKKIPNPFEI